MKTTVDISDDLFDAARTVAARERTTLRALIEEGLRAVLELRRTRRRAFRLRDASFMGDGLLAGVDLANWPEIRAVVYEERGG
jgi:hypothetical protein